MLGLDPAPLEAPQRRGTIARRDPGPPRLLAHFLLAWHNTAENGGWDLPDLWNVDTAVTKAELTVLKLAAETRKYPGDLGFEPEIAAIWRIWRGPKSPRD